MIDETNISQEKAEYNEQRARKVIENLQKHKMNGFYAPTKEAALQMVLEMVPEGAVVARGDGITLDQLRDNSIDVPRVPGTVRCPDISFLNGPTP